MNHFEQLLHLFRAITKDHRKNLWPLCPLDSSHYNQKTIITVSTDNTLRILEIPATVLIQDSGRQKQFSVLEGATTLPFKLILAFEYIHSCRGTGAEKGLSSCRQIYRSYFLAKSFLWGLMQKQIGSSLVQSSPFKLTSKKFAHLLDIFHLNKVMFSVIQKQ